MAEARSRSNWNHTASVLCTIAEVNRDSKRKSSPYKPSDFNPHHQRVEHGLPPKIKMKDLKNLIPAMAELASKRTSIKMERT